MERIDIAVPISVRRCALAPSARLALQSASSSKHGAEIGSERRVRLIHRVTRALKATGHRCTGGPCNGSLRVETTLYENVPSARPSDNLNQDVHAVPTNTELMDRIERVMARNLRDYVIALRQDVPELGAASIDVAGGVAAFSGAGSPLSTVKGAHAELSRRELETIESFFRGCGSRVVTVEVAPWPVGDVAELLLHFGYAPSGTEDVVVACGPSRGERIHSVEPVSADSWRRLMLLRRRQRPTHFHDSSSQPPPACLTPPTTSCPTEVDSSLGRSRSCTTSSPSSATTRQGPKHAGVAHRRRSSLPVSTHSRPASVRSPKSRPAVRQSETTSAAGSKSPHTRQHYTRLLPLTRGAPGAR